jgi:hypothetical protein
MNDMAPQFSPAQILDAARRAEGEGRIDYALKFYRHLVEQFGHLPEGKIAGEALSRLQPPRFAEVPHLPPMSRGRGGYDVGPSGAPTPDPALASNGVPYREARGPRGGRGYVARVDGPPRAGGGGHGFLLGRLLAMALTFGGVLALLAGAAVVGAMAGRVEVILDMMSIAPGFAGLYTGGALIGAGVGMILAGQLASALFAVANGVRELVELQAEVQSAGQDEASDGGHGRYH